MSPQKIWQEEQAILGNCITCGNPRDGEGKRYCMSCQSVLRLRMREKTGSKPWKPGGKGRPPLNMTK